MNIQDLRDQGLIIFEAIGGSRAYGTELPTSDTDIRGVFICPQDVILGTGYVGQVNDQTNDVVFYEIRKFLELVKTNNPNILELLNTPEDCIISKDPLFDLILEHKERFITKRTRNSFGGYAVQQIKKARGLNKKIVKPEISKVKKSPLDFCYVIGGNFELTGSLPITKWLADRYMEQSYCGLTVIPNARDTYALYFCISPEYKGIVKEIDGEFVSNALRLTSIEKGLTPDCYISYNKDGYTKYCKDYKEYWEWVEKRNPDRYAETIKHAKGYDAKNLMHCHRLLDMAIEILDGQGINVRRPNREYLLSIRKGDMDYDTLLADAEDKLEQMDLLFKDSDLPESLPHELINSLLIEIRTKFYAI